MNQQEHRERRERQELWNYCDWVSQGRPEASYSVWSVIQKVASSNRKYRQDMRYLNRIEGFKWE